jgi:hypothetical protein
MEPEIISNLITVAPVVAVLLWVVLYFRSELKEKKEEIKTLNEELRETGKEFITVTKDLNATLKELITEIKTRNV